VANGLSSLRILPVEEELLRVLEDSESKADVYWAVIGLRNVGSAQAVKAKRRYPMQDVKDCIPLTVAHLVGEAETSFYIGALKDKRSRKEFPMWDGFGPSDSSGGAYPAHAAI
jgi:hypothetical protein